MKSENAIGIAEAMYAMYEGLYSSLQGAVQVSRWWWGAGGPLLVSSAILRDRTESQGGLQYHTRPLVWYWRGYTGSQGAVEVSRW